MKPMEKYDIFIQAGQSNADGYGHGPAESRYVPDERILYYTAGTPEACDYYPNSECTVQIAAERPKEGGDPEDRLGDFSLSFAQKYVEAGLLEADRKLLIVRAAVGGTGFLKHYWQVGDPLYIRMLQMTDRVLALNPENRLMGLLWHQGEHEAAFHNDPEVYHQQLKDVVQSVRKHYEKPELPFICGGFCDEWAQKNQPDSDIIMDVIRSVAAECGGRYIETADLRSNNQKFGSGDEIHFCREDLQKLGRRYFDAYQQLRK